MKVFLQEISPVHVVCKIATILFRVRYINISNVCDITIILSKEYVNLNHPTL